MTKFLLDTISQNDKQWHFLCSCFILFLSVPFLGLLYSLIATLLVGFIKECWDHVYGTGFCWLDILANILGTVVGGIIIITW